MLLLSFAATNHKSLRDRAELSFIKPDLRTLRPKTPNRWRDCIEPAVAILGANASGKSNVLDALLFMSAAITHSARTWLSHPQMMRAPFRLDVTSRVLPSVYELDFVISDIRYHYEFSIDNAGVAHETLLDLPGRQWRTLINRNRDTTIRPQPLTKSVGPVSDRELILSRALVLNASPLAEIAHALREGLEFFAYGDSHKSQRLNEIAEALAKGEANLDDVVSILRVADIGVSRVDLTEEEVPSEQRKIIRAIKSVIAGPEEGDADASLPEEANDHDDREFIMRSMQFCHTMSMDTPDGGTVEPFNIHDESSGTIAWLALVMGAVDTLRSGGVYCVDELDASLHSHLVETFISLFTTSEINVGHGQLLFTSHNTNILSPMSRAELHRSQVWFTEKDANGATELFSLVDFTEGSDANHEKRYLEGRYGAVPALAPSEIARIVQRGARQEAA